MANYRVKIAKYLAGLACLITIFLGFNIACSCIRSVVSDVASPTGYIIFTCRYEGFQIGFEYPNNWKRGSIENHGTYIVMTFQQADSNVSVQIASDLNAANGGQFSSAEDLMKRSLNISAGSLELHTIRNDNISSPSGEWQNLVTSYRVTDYFDPHLPKGTVIDKFSTERTLAIDHYSRIYEINLLTDSQEFEQANKGIDHLLNTFTFLK